MTRICIDLDSVICRPKQQESDSYYDLEPYPEAIEALDTLTSEGHYIIIYTARHMRTYGMDLKKIYNLQWGLLTDWLFKWNIKYNELVMGKPWAQIYVDDLALLHTDWKTTLNTITQRLQQ